MPSPTGGIARPETYQPAHLHEALTEAFLVHISPESTPPGVTEKIGEEPIPNPHKSIIHIPAGSDPATKVVDVTHQFHKEYPRLIGSNDAERAMHQAELLFAGQAFFRVSSAYKDSPVSFLVGKPFFARHPGLPTFSANRHDHPERTIVTTRTGGNEEPILTEVLKIRRRVRDETNVYWVTKRLLENLGSVTYH